MYHCGNFPGTPPRNVGRYNHAGQGVGYLYGGYHHPSTIPAHQVPGEEVRQGNKRRRYQQYAERSGGNITLNWIEDDNSSNRNGTQKAKMLESPKNAVIQAEKSKRSECSEPLTNEPTIAVKSECIPFEDVDIKIEPDEKSSTAPPETSANHSPDDVLLRTVEAPEKIPEKTVNEQHQVCAGYGSRSRNEELNNEELAIKERKTKAMAGEKDAQVRFRAMNMWYWRDPEFRKHGPYPYTEMARWYKLNFFRSLNIFVRRESEKVWFPLHDLIAYLNGSPFVAVTEENFAKYSNVRIPGMTLKDLVKCPAKSGEPSNLKK